MPIRHELLPLYGTDWPDVSHRIRFVRAGGRRVYVHALLPKWEYTVAEMRTEMLDDLEHLAATGEQPKAATR